MRFNSAIILIPCIFHASAAVPAHHRSEHYPWLLDRAEQGSDGLAVHYNDTSFAGAILSTQELGTPFHHASGVFTVPSGSSSGAASVMVGIGFDVLDTTGPTPCNGSFSTGVDVFVQVGADGIPTYRYLAWFHASPDGKKHAFPNFNVSVGDNIQVSVNATSRWTGTAVIQNLSIAETVTQYIISAFPFCERGAGWIVAPLEGLPLTNFTKLTFFYSMATETRTGKSYPPYAADTYDILQGDKPLTSTENGRYIDIKYL